MYIFILLPLNIIMAVNIIVAHAQNRVIGKGNEIPWYIREDMKFFKEATIGKPVIMGRKTYESIPEKHRPLPNRTTFLLTRNPGYSIDDPDVKVVNDFEKALFEAKLVCDEVYIAGGSQIYEQAIPHTDRVYATVLLEDFEGDTYFPVLPSEEWHIVDSVEDFVDEQLDLLYRRYIYQRKRKS